MPDQKVTQLPLIPAVDLGDFVLVIDDPTGTPVSKKATVDQLMSVPNPSFTGQPTTSTAPGGFGNSSTQVANCMFVVGAIDQRIDQRYNSPALGGTPTAPTAPPGTNTTQIATTEFVRTALGGSQAVSLTGTADNLTLTGGVRLVRCTNATKLTITGMTAGYDGQVVTIMSVGTGEVHFSHQDPGSLAVNRLINVATSTTTPLAPNIGRATYIYDAMTTRWRLTGHDQGAAIAYVATWTALGGSPTLNPSIGNGTITSSYLLWGKVIDLFLQFTFGSTTRFGNGYWVIGVPAALAGTSPVGTGFITTALGNNHPVICTIPSTGITIVLTSSEQNVGGTDPNAGTPGPSSPVGLVAGDVMRVALASYPIA